MMEKQMKHCLIGLTLSLFITTASWADTPQPVIPVAQYPQFNTIHYQTSVEQWVTTKTALVTIGVDASLNQTGMDNMQQQVSDSLKSLASDINWQMTDYERTQDASGLERVHIEEQARLTADQLTNLRTKTDTLSKPGIKYSIIDIQFTPSLAEIQVAQDNLRSQLYSKVKQEIELLNKNYDQTFYVHDLEFSPGDASPPQPMAQNNGNYKMVQMAAVPSSSQATMSQRMVMSVDVVLASTVK